jgi:hypothetical protein
MNRILRIGDRGDDVAALEGQLTKRGYPVEVDGIFGSRTYDSVRAFQSQHVDRNGGPLYVDGVVGPVTWWSLTHPKPRIETQSAIDFKQMPPGHRGGGSCGREALAAAIGEINAGAREIGGNNRGPWVRKYLNGLGPQGRAWAAGFVSWCYAQCTGGIPFTYSINARDIYKEFRRNGWAHEPSTGYIPQPGDLVVWWRLRLDEWQGHAGLVYEAKDGFLYTIEGNKSPRVQGFSYVESRVVRLLGFGHVPEGEGGER